MIWFYIGALIPTLVGGALFYFNRKVNWAEWLGGSAIAFLLAAIFHLCAIHGMAADIQTVSGQIVRATFHPEWVEKYKVAIYKTVTRGTGKNRRTARVFSHYETRYRTHREFWDCETNIGTEPGISREEFDEIKSRFRNFEQRKVFKDGFHSGDPNIYVSENKTGFIFPATSLRSWENRIKAAPSVFSFSKVPESVKVHKWPENPNWRQSDRLIGTALTMVSQQEFDRMNARLGPVKKVNVIICGWGNESREIAEWQEAAWIGGKKNDLVLCFGGGSRNEPAKWAKVFGWTERAIVKRNLEAMLVSNPISDALLPEIEAEIRSNYEIKDWSKFDYIAIEPPTWAIVTFFIVMIATQTGFYFWAHINECDQTRL